MPLVWVLVAQLGQVSEKVGPKTNEAWAATTQPPHPSVLQSQSETVSG